MERERPGEEESVARGSCPKEDLFPGETAKKKCWQGTVESPSLGGCLSTSETSPEERFPKEYEWEHSRRKDSRREG